MTSEAQKRARDKWDRENMTVLTCKVTKRKADEFAAACQRAGVSKSSVITRAVDNFISENPEDASGS